MAALSTTWASSSCPIDMSFDLVEALALPLPPPPPQQGQSCRVASTTLLAAVGSMPTVDAPAEVCSVCMESFRPPGHSGRRVPCGHVYHQACIAEWSLRHNSCPLCRLQIFQDN